MASKLFLVFVVSILVCAATATAAPARNLAGSEVDDEKTVVVMPDGSGDTIIGGGTGYEGGGEGIGGGTTIIGGGTGYEGGGEGIGGGTTIIGGGNGYEGEGEGIAGGDNGVIIGGRN